MQFLQWQDGKQASAFRPVGMIRNGIIHLLHFFATPDLSAAEQVHRLATS